MAENGHVQLADYSDREILLMMLDLGGEVSTPDLASRIYGWTYIQEQDEAKVRHGRHCVGSRLSWMRRFGLVESMIEVVDGKEKKGTRTWRVSNPGKNMVGFELTRPAEAYLSRISDEGGLVLANRVGERLVKAGEITGTAMRRELQFQINRRRRK